MNMLFPYCVPSKELNNSLATESKEKEIDKLLDNEFEKK
jgi:hypothetical protein